MTFCTIDNSNNKYRFDLIDWCKQFLTKDSTFIDIGSHCGTYSLIISKHCKKVYSFEPRKQHYDALNAGICINMSFNVNPFNIALGSSEYIDKIYSIDDMKATLNKDIATNFGSFKEEEVQIKTLDSYNLKNIDFIKIDVCGNGIEVLKGAKQTLISNEYPPFIIDTYSESWYDPYKNLLLEYMKELGYKLFPLTGHTTMYLAADHPNRKKKIIQGKYDIDDIVKQYQTGKINNSSDWELWYTLTVFYKNRKEYNKSNDCAIKGLSTKCDKKYLFYLELSVISFYNNKLVEGYNYCDDLILANDIDWKIRNTALLNQSNYMSKLSVDKIMEVKYQLSNIYKNSSASIISNEDKYLMCLRYVNYSIRNDGSYNIFDPNNTVRTRNILLTLNKELNIEDAVEMVNTSDTYLFSTHIVGLEDVRLFGDKYLFCTNLEVNNQAVPQICFCEYDNKTGGVNKIYPLQVANKLQCEKNWLPFIDNDKIYFIYSFEPFRIYELNSETRDIKLVKETKIYKNKNLDTFRGSASPIPYKNGWLFSIHQVHYSNPRKYFHRLVWMNKEFNDLRYSNVFYFEAVTIEYNLSICHSDNGLLLTYSQNDNSTKICLLNYKILDDMLKL